MSATKPQPEAVRMSPPSAAPPAATTEAAAERRRRLVCLAVSAGILMSTLALTIVNVAFPAIQRSFSDAPLSSLSWVLNGYAIIFAALLVPAGRFADRYSMRTIFLGGMALFTMASVLCAVSQDVPMLVGARVLQAVGAAAMSPTSLGLIIAAFPAGQRGRAMRVWSTAAGVAAASGPLVGGVLVNADWRWIFLVNLPVGVAALALGTRVLTRSPARAQDRPLPDLLGSVLLVLAVGALALSLVKGPDWGWASARIVGGFAVAVVGTVLLVWRSRHHRSPVLDLALLRIRSFAVANVAAAFFYMSFAALIMSVALWCQTVWGWSALLTGLAMAPGNLLLPFLTNASGRVSARIGNVMTMVGACAVIVLGTLWWVVAVRLHTNYVVGLLPGVLLTRAGLGLGLAPLMSLATRDLAPATIPTGTGINNMIRQVGFVLGISGLVVLIGTPTSPQAALTGFRWGWVFTAAAAAAALLVVLPLRRTAAQGSPTR